MALSLRSAELESMARELSRRTGETMTDVIRAALAARLSGMGAGSDALRAELTRIAFESASAPDLDVRSPDAILGYNESGGLHDGH